MKKVMATGVKFKNAGKVYDFVSTNLGEKAGDWVVIEADKGEDIANVVTPCREVQVDDKQEMKKVIRIATEKDFKQREVNTANAHEALHMCRGLVKDHSLQMKLLLAEYSLDRSKLTFYYTADNRVDFRQLVKDLAKVYRTRIEMRQIGVRDATKILGGFGSCGRDLCCATFLKKFDNISIKTAKGQSHNMNPTKISGICGRLMCCLVYERGCGECKEHKATFMDEEIDLSAIVVDDKKLEGDV